MNAPEGANLQTTARYFGASHLTPDQRPSLSMNAQLLLLPKHKKPYFNITKCCFFNGRDRIRGTKNNY